MQVKAHNFISGRNTPCLALECDLLTQAGSCATSLGEVSVLEHLLPAAAHGFPHAIEVYQNSLELRLPLKEPPVMHIQRTETQPTSGAQQLPLPLRNYPEVLEFVANEPTVSTSSCASVPVATFTHKEQ